MIDHFLDNIEWYGNYIEAYFWIAVGCCFLLAAISRKMRGDKLVAAAVFVAFGCSDFVEMHTGAWWRPWWLLAWKAACVIAMCLLLVRHYRNQRRKRAS